MGALPVRRRALLSVSDRTHLAELAAALTAQGFELLASGGTAAFLQDRGFGVSEVSRVTGFPEIFGGRVKTLHPLIHGGILGPTAADFTDPALQALGLAPIDVVVVNLYPFAATLAAGATAEQLIEQIDIGGPALLRAAAKNHRRVTVLSEPAQYEEFARECRAGGGQPSDTFRRRCALAAFRLVSAYDHAIAAWLQGALLEAGASVASGLPAPPSVLKLRYGENPHQEAACIVQGGGGDLGRVGLNLLGGKELSYNNLVDLIAALKLAQDLPAPGCAIIKHTNPCGLGLGVAAEALHGALLCDPVSAFGGIFAFNQPIDRQTTESLRGRFLELVVASGYCEKSLKLLLKRRNLRVLTWDPTVFAAATRGRTRSWGLLQLVQDEDEGFSELADLKIAAGEPPNDAVRRDLELAWIAAKHGKSNAIVLVRGGATLGCGFGQMSRVDSVRLAVRKAQQAQLDLDGCVAASDGFFPFPDGIEELARAGVGWILAPAGSVRDDEVATAARALGVTLILASRRHFNH